MHNSALVFLLNESVRAVLCQYEKGEGSYIFKTFDQSIQVDDLVVVETGTRHGFTVVKVTAVDVQPDFNANIDLKWIVQKVDTAPHLATVAQEKEAITAATQAKLRREREQLRKDMFADQEATFAALAIASPPKE